METIQDPREPYEAPVVEDVPLAPEESMMLSPCKGNGFSSGFNTGLSCFILSQPCRNS
jgi:hypothetical protein